MDGFIHTCCSLGETLLLRWRSPAKQDIRRRRCVANAYGLSDRLARSRRRFPQDPRDAASMNVVVIVSADGEWRVVKAMFPEAAIQHSPFDEYFELTLGERELTIFHGGWGKIS